MKRYGLLDTIRGITVISMILYHAMWNLVFLYGFDFNWYRSNIGRVWQQSICWTFILLSGFCFSIGRHHLRRGLIVFGAGLAVTVFTLIFMPEEKIIFGIMTFMGSAMLIMIPIDRLVQNLTKTKNGKLRERLLSPENGKSPQNRETLENNQARKVFMLVCMFISIAAFVLTKTVNKGYFGFDGIPLAKVPAGWYHDMVTTFFGFPMKGFISSDYFSFFPWFFLFLTGYFLFQVISKQESRNEDQMLKDAVKITNKDNDVDKKTKRVLEGSVWYREIPPLSFVGRHALPIYLLHQAVLSGAMWVLFDVLLK